MVSNSFKSIVVLAAYSLWLAACTGNNGYVAPDYKAENLIGAPLSKNSKLQSSTEDDSEKVVIFDKTIHKVHHFDLDSATHLGQYEVDQPDEDHFLIYGSGMKYFVDLTKRNINIQPLNGDRNPSPVKFVGTPISATIVPFSSIL